MVTWTNCRTEKQKMEKKKKKHMDGNYHLSQKYNIRLYIVNLHLYISNEELTGSSAIYKSYQVVTL